MQGVGNIKVKLHRPVFGKIKTVTVRRQNEHWYVCFSCEATRHILPESNGAVGIDVGLSSFATQAEGQRHEDGSFKLFPDSVEIENPRLYAKAQKKLRRALPMWCQGAEEAFGSRTCLHRVWSHHYQRPCKRDRNTRTEPSTGNGGAVMLLWVEKPAPLGDGVVTHAST